jgi:t-SNARE complex subunit (syntaxin)
MLEARVQELERLIPFLRKEAVKKEAAEKEDNDDEEEDMEAWPSGSSDDDDPVSPIRFSRVKRWFKCPICFNYLYEHKNTLLFHIKNFIKDETSPPYDVVK